MPKVQLPRLQLLGTPGCADRRTAVDLWLVALAMLMLTGCASSSTPTVTKPATNKRVFRSKRQPRPDRAPVSDDGMKIRGLMGTLDSSQVDDGLRAVLPAANGCFATAARARPYLGGTMRLRFRIAQSGVVERLVLYESSLGAFRIERCVISALSRARFDRPSGGDHAEFTYELSFPARMGGQDWTADQVSARVAIVRRELRRRAPRGLIVTMYISARGRLSAAGMAAQEPITAPFAADLLARLGKLKFDRPMASFAKVSFRW